MSIIAGQIVLAGDFINEAGKNATPANDTGKAVKLESDANISPVFLRGGFGGTGADGALTITSGATNIDLLGAAVVTKNYTSISITGTGSLTFTNPHANGTTIILKCSRNVTLTSSTAPTINCSALGGLAGVGVQQSGSGNSSGGGGNNGTTPTLISGGGNGGAVGPTGAGGAAPTAYRFSAEQTTDEYVIEKYPKAFLGGGGGAGNALSGGGNVTGGNGGRGGGCLIIECAGDWNFTTVGGISVSGAVGNIGTQSGATGNWAAGGGAGGGAGSFLALYKTLIANSGTITVTAGIGANTLSNGGTNGIGGGGGASGTNGGTNQTVASNGNKSGGNGGAGFSLVAQNTMFV